MLLKKALLGAVASAVTLSVMTSAAEAQTPCGDRPYIAVRTGLSMLKNHIHKNAWEGGIAAGMQLNSFRTELEYMYREGIKGNSMGTDHKIDTMSMLFNVFYDMHTGSSLYPYINLSAGVTKLKTDQVGVATHRDYKMTWGGGAGMAWDMTQSVTLDVGYRFLDLGRNVKSNEFYGGLRFAF